MYTSIIICAVVAIQSFCSRCELFITVKKMISILLTYYDDTGIRHTDRLCSHFLRIGERASEHATKTGGQTSIWVNFHVQID